ncbi:hypothetical protein AB4Y45_32495 [Paraburkholderia sp. EG287A]|uniref:hypothetical protein n=1 Tax=Paraburkholderia sp. EG287A TaxID=3237012 RepID=UPI0034D35078
MKDKLNLLVFGAPTDSVETVVLSLNDQPVGRYAVRRSDSIVVPGLLLAGFTSVRHAGDPHTRPLVTRETLDCLVHLVENRQPDRGCISLSRRWDDPLEEYRFDVHVNDVRRGSVTAGMDMAALQRVFSALGFDVSAQRKT